MTNGRDDHDRNWVERLAASQASLTTQPDTTKPAVAHDHADGLADLGRSLSFLAAEKRRRESELAQAEATMLQERERARIASKGYWSEYSAMIRAALERVDDVLAQSGELQVTREPDTRLNEEDDSYEGTASVYTAGGENLCNVTIRVEEEDINFDVYDLGADELVPSEYYPKVECRTALDIANIIAKLVRPAVERALAPRD